LTHLDWKIGLEDFLEEPKHGLDARHPSQVLMGTHPDVAVHVDIRREHANERPSVSFPTAGKRGSIMLERVVVPAHGQLLQGDIHVIEPLSSSDEQISHVGEELGYVIEGELELTPDTERYLLQRGDSFYFPSGVPHSYRNPGKVVTRALWINTQPTF
jgi:quercetin dioxygenase-like cupin family protein